MVKKNQLSNMGVNEPGTARSYAGTDYPAVNATARNIQFALQYNF